MNTTPALFDPALLAKRQKRAAASFAQADFFIKHASELLLDRLHDVTHRFERAVLLGGYHGVVEPILAAAKNIDGLEVIELDEKEVLPLEPQSCDVILSAWGLHWVNDLPGVLTQIRHALKPDGCFIAQLPGPKTLQELRDSFARAAAATNAPLHNHIAPFAEVRDIGNLLQRAGFTLPVIDSHTLNISYSSPLKLLHELRAMGETNMMASQTRHILPRNTFTHALALYHDSYAEDDGRIPVSVEIISLTAWAPHASQPKPAERGSGKVNLREIL